MTSSWTLPTWTIASQAPAYQVDHGFNSVHGSDSLFQSDTDTRFLAWDLVFLWFNTTGLWLPGMNKWTWGYIMSWICSSWPSGSLWHCLFLKLNRNSLFQSGWLASEKAGPLCLCSLVMGAQSCSALLCELWSWSLKFLGLFIVKNIRKTE